MIKKAKILVETPLLNSDTQVITKNGSDQKWDYQCFDIKGYGCEGGIKGQS